MRHLFINNFAGPGRVTTSVDVELNGTFALAEVALTDIVLFDAAVTIDPSQWGVVRAAGFAITQIVHDGVPETLGSGVISVARDKTTRITVAGWAEQGRVSSMPISESPVYVVHDGSDGRIVHIHSTMSLNGARSRDLTETVLAQARRTAPKSSLRVLRESPDAAWLRSNTAHRVDLATSRVVPVERKERPR